jgi:membrane AbrB-like protein
MAGPLSLDMLDELAILLSASTVVAIIAHRIRFPGGLLFGAMLTSAILHGSGLIHAVMPWWAVNTAMVAMGAITGSRFANTSPRMLLNFVAAAFGSFAVAVAISAVFAAILISLLSLRVAEVMIAFAPGSVDAMMLLALALSLDPVYVGAHHLTRIFFVSLTMPLLARYSAPRAKDDRRKRKTADKTTAIPGLTGRLDLFRCGRLLAATQPEPIPDVDQRFGKRIDQRIVVVGRGCNAETFHPAWHGWIVDRLDIDAVLGKQQIACRLALLGVADENRHDMRRARHHRQACCIENCFYAGGAFLVALAFPT